MTVIAHWSGLAKVTFAAIYSASIPLQGTLLPHKRDLCSIFLSLTCLKGY